MKHWPTTDELPAYEDWKQEVANGDTVLGFRDWLEARTLTLSPAELLAEHGHPAYCEDDYGIREGLEK